MMNSHLLLIAYSSGGQHLALDLFESLEHFGTITLRPYSRVKSAGPDDNFDLVLCVVTDDMSLQEAHDLQQRVAETPTLVVNNTRGGSIPINGFIGLVSPVPQEIIEAVKEILDANPSVKNDRMKTSVAAESRPALASRFDITLSRLGGLSQGFQVVLAAATRHLSWELRSERVEAYVVEPSGNARQIFCNPASSLAPAAISSRVLSLLKKRASLTCVTDLFRSKDRPLLDYLQARELNVIAPMMPGNELLGWLALGLESSMLTPDFLDDLHVALHLLNMSLVHAKPEEVEPQASPWHQALAAFRVGMLVVDAEGKVLDFVGETALLGSVPAKGDSFRKIRSGRIREVIAESLKGNFMMETWSDPRSGQLITCAALALANETVALSFGVVRGTVEKNPSLVQPEIELASFFESLPLPVLPDGSAGPSAALPVGLISRIDSEQIRRCANAAKTNNVKALRIRYRPQRGPAQAVLFFETPSVDAESHLARDIVDSVQFVVTPA